MAMKRKSGKEMPMPAAIAIGILGSLAMTFAGAALLAYLIGKGTVAQLGVGYGAMVILVACAAAGALLSTGLYRHRKLMVCGVTALGYYLCLLAMTAMFFGGQYQGMGVTALMILLGAGITMVPAMVGKGKKTKHKIPSYR